jgi:hypothetical protein
MRFTRIQRSLAAAMTASLIGMSSVTSNATSVIVDAKADRIVLVVDSLSSDTNLGGISVKSLQKCKIAVLGGHSAFAGFGHVAYSPTALNDPVPVWDALPEAARAYKNVANGDLRKTADAWGDSARQEFQVFYQANPQRVRQIAYQNGVLLIGIFAGSNSNHSLEVYNVVIRLDEHRGGSSQILSEMIPSPKSPYSPNAVTQELLEGQTERARQTRAAWDKRHKGPVQTTVGLRWYEYLIQETGKYDEGVGGPINALEIKPNAKIIWLRNCTCH